MLSVNMLSDVILMVVYKLSDDTLSVVILMVAMLGINMPNVVLLSGVVLNVVAPIRVVRRVTNKPLNVFQLIQ